MLENHPFGRLSLATWADGLHLLVYLHDEPANLGIGSVSVLPSLQHFSLAISSSQYYPTQAAARPPTGAGVTPFTIILEEEMFAATASPGTNCLKTLNFDCVYVVIGSLL